MGPYQQIGKARTVIDLFSHGIQSLAAVAARKGVTLDFRLVPLSHFSDEEAAAAVGADIGQIVKAVFCLAIRPEGDVIPMACLISGRNQLDLELLKAVTGEPAVRQISEREAQALFGPFSGGVPPFGHGPSVQTVMDQSLGRYEWLWAAAGVDGTVIRIAPATLRMLSNAVVAPVGQTSWMRHPAPAPTRVAAPHIGVGPDERSRGSKIGDGS